MPEKRVGGFLKIAYEERINIKLIARLVDSFHCITKHTATYTHQGKIILTLIISHLCPK